MEEKRLEDERKKYLEREKQREEQTRKQKEAKDRLERERLEKERQEQEERDRRLKDKEDESTRKSALKIGLIGLNNIGNTCYLYIAADLGTRFCSAYLTSLPSMDTFLVASIKPMERGSIESHKHMQN